MLAERGACLSDEAEVAGVARARYVSDDRLGALLQTRKRSDVAKHEKGASEQPPRTSRVLDWCCHELDAGHRSCLHLNEGASTP
jgi:hypothetical protein